MAYGEAVVLLDQKERIYYATLKEGGVTDIRGHRFEHDALVGQRPGFVALSSRGRVFSILRPSLVDQVLKMPRYATIVYPKDLALFLIWADIFPGARVLEAGVGSGALSTTVLRAIGPEGQLFSYDLVPDAINLSRKNVTKFLGPQPNHVLRQRDVYEGIIDEPLDRVLLDVPEPWQVVPHAERALRDGGIFAAYSPTVPQMQQTYEALRRSQRFTRIECMETLLRPWHIDRASVRPEQQIIGHTGFLTFARKVRPLERPAVEGEEGAVGAEGGEAAAPAPIVGEGAPASAPAAGDDGQG